MFLFTLILVVHILWLKPYGTYHSSGITLHFLYNFICELFYTVELPIKSIFITALMRKSNFLSKFLIQSNGY